MATSGTLGTLSGSYKTTYTVTWSLLSQSIEKNTSTIRLTATFYTGNSTTISSSYSTFTLDGTTVYSGAYSFSGAGTKFTKTKDITVKHNNDGTFPTRSVSFSTNDYIMGNQSGSGKITGVATIPRASSVSGGSGNIGSSTTITISRASSSFTHTLEYSFGNLTGTIATKTTSTSVNWTIPTDFYGEVKTSNSGAGTITCKTYNGSTLIGTSTCSFTAKVTNSNPTVGSFTYEDSNSATTEITGDNQKIIRNNSNLLFTVGTATPKNSATISKYEVTFNGITKSRTSAGDLDFGTINLSSNSTATLKVIDSRGNYATKKITITIDDWVRPSALITLNRKNNFYSETILKVDGSYSSLNQKNEMTIRYIYKKVTDENYSLVYEVEDNVEEILDLDNEFQWDVKVIVSDKLGSTTYNLSLDKGMPIAFFDRLKNSVGINCFPSSANSFYMNGYKLNDGIAVYGAGNTDPNTTLDELVLTRHENNPYGESAFAYIQTMFYSKKSETSNRAQIAYPYNSNKDIYQRYYYSGSWSEWKSIKLNAMNDYSSSKTDVYSCDYVNTKINNFSSKEQRIGTWIDSKPLYRKVISTTKSVPSGTTTIAHGISNVNKIFVENAYIFHATNGYSYQLPSIGYDGNFTDNDYVWLDRTNINIVSNGSWGTAWEKVIILNYTKTTD